MIFMAPLSFLLVSRPWRWAQWWRLVWQAMLVALAVTAPFILWDAPAFMKDVVLLQFQQPFRLDSDSYLAWLVRQGGPQLPTWTGFVAVVPATVLGFMGLAVSSRNPSLVDWLVAGIAIVLIAGASAMALRHRREPEAATPA